MAKDSQLLSLPDDVKAVIKMARSSRSRLSHNEILVLVDFIESTTEIVGARVCGGCGTVATADVCKVCVLFTAHEQARSADPDRVLQAAFEEVREAAKKP